MSDLQDLPDIAEVSSSGWDDFLVSLAPWCRSRGRAMLSLGLAATMTLLLLALVVTLLVMGEPSREWLPALGVAGGFTVVAWGIVWLRWRVRRALASRGWLAA